MHRDLHYGNFMIDKNKDLYMLDFGLSIVLSEDTDFTVYPEDDP